MKKVITFVLAMCIFSLVEAGCSCGDPRCGGGHGDSNQSYGFNASNRGGNSSFSQKTSSGYGQSISDDRLSKKNKKKSLSDSLRKQFERVSIIADDCDCESCVYTDVSFEKKEKKVEKTVEHKGCDCPECKSEPKKEEPKKEEDKKESSCCCSCKSCK